MTKTKVLIMGAGGMLGSITAAVFAEDDSFEVTATIHNQNTSTEIKSKMPNAKLEVIDVSDTKVEDLVKAIGNNKWIINCIGIIKPYIHDDNFAEVLRATKVNSVFPHYLALAAEKAGAKVIQIATDCVYSGTKGKYVENDTHDAYDVYGKTKSIGEAFHPNMYHLRDSIIGPELSGHLSLMDWFVKQQKDATVGGYTNHQWNGVTTFHFAKLCIGIIKSDIKLAHMQHIIPSGMVSKYELLQSLAKEFDRTDITINKTEATTVVDRTLSTNDDAKNVEIWNAAGYSKIPTVPEMIHELSEFMTAINARS